MINPAAIRVLRASAVALLAVWIAGTSVVAASHDHDSARLAARAADSPREATSPAGACLVCRVFSANVVAEAAPVAERVPDGPPILQPAPAALPLRALARCVTRPRSPPRQHVAA